MIEEDYRYISCGGDPFMYLKSAFKATKMELDPGQEIRILLSKDKFPYDRNIFESLAGQNKLRILEFKEDGNDLIIEMLRENN
ncbi:MAG: hypothetical protein M1496_01260 [Candidatus Thermoplasmatota archaeon]|jgi:hypothetical protein|nr:hypothetical protein [Candidatus Thermoplasmatota archaeon]